MALPVRNFPAEPRSRVKSRLPLNIAFGFAALAALALLLVNQSIKNLDLWLLSFALIAIGIVPLILEMRKGSFDLFCVRNAFIAYYLLSFSGWMIWLLLTDQPYFLGSVETSHGLYRTAMVMACVGLIFFQIGFSIPIGRAIASLVPDFAPAVSLARMRAAVAILLVIATVSYVVLFTINGGFFYFIRHVWEFRTTSEMLGMAPLLKGVSFASFAFLIWYAVRGLRRPTLALALLAGVMFWGLIAAERLMSVGALVSMVLIYHYCKRPIVPRLRHFVIAPVLIFVFLVANGIYTTYRFKAMYTSSASRAVEEAIEEPDLISNSFQGFMARFFGVEALARIMDYTPSEVPYCYGVPQVEFLFTSLIPHKIWPGKPEAPQLKMNDLYWTWMQMSDFGSPIATMVGEAYWMGGPLGAVLLCFLCGVACSAAHSYLKRSRSVLTVVWYSAAFFSACLINESFITYLTDFFQTMVVLVPMLWFIGQRVSRPGDGARSPRIDQLGGTKAAEGSNVEGRSAVNTGGS